MIQGGIFMYNYIKQLDHDVLQAWNKIKRGPFYSSLYTGSATFDLYAALLIEIYHCIQHKPENQNLHSLQLKADGHPISSAFYRIAKYEKQIESDLRGVLLSNHYIVDNKLIQNSPTSAAVALNAYQHYMTINNAPIARLAYYYVLLQSQEYFIDMFAYFKELPDFYDLHNDFIQVIKQTALPTSDDIRKILMAYCHNTQHQKQLIQVGQTSLFLIASLLNNIAEQQMPTEENDLHGALIAA